MALGKMLPRKDSCRCFSMTNTIALATRQGYFLEIVCVPIKLLHQRFLLPACGRAWILFGSRTKLEARKMLENAAESHTSGALSRRFSGRFVGHLFQPFGSFHHGHLLKILMTHLPHFIVAKRRGDPPSMSKLLDQS